MGRGRNDPSVPRVVTGGRTKMASGDGSRVLPPYMRRSPKVAEVLRVLYLRGLSTGDFREALAGHPNPLRRCSHL